MKKCVATILILYLMFTACISSFAQEAVVHEWDSYTPKINGETANFIHSDYYKIYYNELFEHRYPKTQEWNNTDKESEKDFSYFYSLLEKDTYTYITVIFYDKPNDADYYTYNTDNLKLTFSDEEILYVGDTTPMAVVKLNYNKIDLLNDNKNIQCTASAFFSTAELIEFIYGGQKMGNVLSNSDVTAADARFVLRFAAGLETVDMYSAKNFYFVADMDMDGHISAADARLILRTAAGFEDTKEIAFSYAAYWNDFA